MGYLQPNLMITHTVVGVLQSREENDDVGYIAPLSDVHMHTHTNAFQGRQESDDVGHPQGKGEPDGT